MPNQPQPFPHDVFLSHSHQDKAAVHALARRLEKDGLTVWLDDWVIQPGDPIGLKIQQGVENTRVLILCMSPAYFASQWGQLEHHSLLFRDPANTERRFIPLLLADCRIPAILAQFARIDWRSQVDEEWFRESFRFIRLDLSACATQHSRSIAGSRINCTIEATHS
uniref:TIR domain-containing protein n=1 Tax=Candidatus Kentrum eta TaxID=2126337 RepID=A0A450UIA8_9GAMM|nr:MAG: TIR domain-containing protein [Candidatus Kentron sp. H]VFJ92276.1 MAG: TIR domain-containing protein [Candidatus Kentron sp. H]VFK01448.1 MAG: TIR domain-containing protein [Candidatus Kentron sp. H]